MSIKIIVMPARLGLEKRRGGGCSPALKRNMDHFTVTVRTIFFLLFSVTVILALPFFRATMRPSLVTLATFLAEDLQVLMVKGAIPGPTHSVVIVKKAVKK